MFVLVLDLNFPCKYVVYGRFSFQIFFPILSFPYFENRENRGQRAEKTVSEKPENKKQSCQDNKSCRSAVRLLYSIFSWIFYLFSSAFEQVFPFIPHILPDYSSASSRNHGTCPLNRVPPSSPTRVLPLPDRRSTEVHRPLSSA